MGDGRWGDDPGRATCCRRGRPVFLILFLAAMQPGCRLTSPPNGVLSPMTEYGPLPAEPRELWGTSRDVLLDLGFLFVRASSEDGTLETRWKPAPGDRPDTEYRCRVRLRMAEAASGGTTLFLSVDRDSMPLEEPGGAAEPIDCGADRDLQDRLVSLIRIRLRETGAAGK